jgi:Tfp pilus assembly protein PilF
MEDKFFLISLLAFFISCSSTDYSKEKKRAELFFSNGTTYLVKGDFTKALDNLMKAAKLDPERSDIQNNLGMAYYFKGKKNTALKKIKLAIKLDKANTEARANLASIYLRAKIYNKARYHYEKVLEDLTYNKQYQTYYNLGLLELKNNKENKAEHFFKLSIKENEYSCNALYQLGRIALKNSKLEEAIKLFDKGSDGPCTNSEVNNYHLAIAHQAADNYVESSEGFRKFLVKFPKSKFKAQARQRLSALTEPGFETIIQAKEQIQSL